MDSKELGLEISRVIRYLWDYYEDAKAAQDWELAAWYWNGMRVATLAQWVRA